MLPPPYHNCLVVFQHMFSDWVPMCVCVGGMDARVTSPSATPTPPHLFACHCPGASVSLSNPHQCGNKFTTFRPSRKCASNSDSQRNTQSMANRESLTLLAQIRSSVDTAPDARPSSNLLTGATAPFKYMCAHQGATDKRRHAAAET